MAHKYVCRDAGLNCDVELRDENEEKLRQEAEEHLRRDHPTEAIEQEKVRGYWLGGWKPA